MNIQDNHINLAAEMARRDEAILDEIKTLVMKVIP